MRKVIRTRGKRVRTERALVQRFARMSCSVFGQLQTPAELLLANVALKLFHLQVNVTDVRGKCVSGLAFLLAGVADVPPLVSMSVEVRAKCFRVLVPQFADRALNAW